MALLLSAMLLTLPAASPLSGLNAEPKRLFTSPTRAGSSSAETWLIGPAGGRIGSPERSVIIAVPKNGAVQDTHVRVVIHQTLRQPLVKAIEPLMSFDVEAVKGRLKQGVVTVRYNLEDLRRKGVRPESLIMLMSDTELGWEALRTSIDTTTGSATAEWPHFSTGVLGYIKRAGQHVFDTYLTAPIGPRKPAHCKKKKDLSHGVRWPGKDEGWKFSVTNADGGRMLVPPLDGCAASEVGGEQAVELTNRYWFSFKIRPPTGAYQELFDLLNYSETLDIGLAYISRVRGFVLVPGHSRAHLRVKNKPSGQKLVFEAEIDRASYLVYAILTLLDVSSGLSAKALRASMEASVSSLYKDLGKGKTTVADIQEKTEEGSPWREEELQKHSRSESNVLEQGFDRLTVADCIVGVTLEHRFPEHEPLEEAENDADQKLVDPFSSDKKLLSAIYAKCKKQLTRYLTDRIFERWDPREQGKMYQEVLKSALDTKAILGTIELAFAGCKVDIACLGQDYTRARVTAVQDPWPAQRCADHFSPGVSGATEWDVFVRGLWCNQTDELLDLGFWRDGRRNQFSCTSKVVDFRDPLKDFPLANRQWGAGSGVPLDFVTPPKDYLCTSPDGRQFGFTSDS